MAERPRQPRIPYEAGFDLEKALVGQRNGKESAPLRVAVCVPMRGYNNWRFTAAVSEMIGYSVATLTSNRLMDLAYLWGPDTYVDQNRHQLSVTAVEGGATHLMWLDDDMVFPRDTMLRLLARNVPIVGANYAMRKMPAPPVALEHNGGDGVVRKRLYPYEDQPEMVPVDTIGFGCVMVQARVFDDLGPAPWFRQYYSDEKQKWVGEDFHFCELARAAGYKVWVDTDLSNAVKHVGDFEYSLAHSIAMREEDPGVHQKEG